VRAACTRCGRVAAINRHHCTGRGADGRYLHPRLTVPLCVPCHDGMHAVMRGAGIDGDREATPYLVLARIAACLSWISEAAGPYVVTQDLFEELTIALETPLVALLGTRTPREEAA